MGNVREQVVTTAFPSVATNTLHLKLLHRRSFSAVDIFKVTLKLCYGQDMRSNQVEVRNNEVLSLYGSMLCVSGR